MTESAFVQLDEWQTATPDTHPRLRGLTLAAAGDQALVELLNTRQIVRIKELRNGLEIATNSFVGSLALGSLSLRIQPKLHPNSFNALVGYALGLPDVELLPEHAVHLTLPAFQDLLAMR